MIGRLIKAIIILVLLAIALFFGAFIYVYQEIELDADQLINYSPEVSSEILDRNGRHLAYVFKKRHRLYATFDELPGYLVEALIATEDTAFFEHKGINPDAIIRAMIVDIKAGKFVEGGSTLTQQLVKNKLLSNEKKLSRKIREAILAIKIENVLTKEQIIERYLNEIPYGNNYYGVKTAAQGYFHKNLRDLTLKEVAILVGIPNAPSYYNPLRHYKRTLNRANTILYRMKTLGWITENEYLEAIKEVPKVYRTSLTQNIAPYIVDEVLRRFRGKFVDLRTGGYKIYTTIDMEMQMAGRKALKKGYERAEKMYGGKRGADRDINGALIAVENSTGDILSMIGGVDYRSSAFNRVTMMKRQPGSAFKPFIYQTALDLGYNPASRLTDLARTFQYYQNGKKKIWAPKNYEHDFKGFITLREALVHSRNLATINLVADIGVKTIRRRLSLLDVKKIPRDMSIALGNLPISPQKMAQIYTVFSNGGHMIEPRLVSKIVSREKAVLYETKPKEIANFTRPEQAYLMTSILEDVIKRGTGRKAAVKGIELAGKTGTTNDGVDTWFCGYSPTITTIVWYGRDSNKPLGRKATGGKVSAPVFADFYRRVVKIYPNIPKKFPIPDGVYIGEVDGKKELYTKMSPLPEKTSGDFLDEGFLPSRPKSVQVELPGLENLSRDEEKVDSGEYAVEENREEANSEKSLTKQELKAPRSVNEHAVNTKGEESSVKRMKPRRHTVEKPLSGRDGVAKTVRRKKEVHITGDPVLDSLEDTVLEVEEIDSDDFATDRPDREEKSPPSGILPEDGMSDSLF